MTTGLSASRKTPGIYLAVILGGAGTSSGAAPKTILLQGNAVLSARAATLNLLASPQIAITAGTMAAATPTFCASADDAGTYAARGSELHSMAEALRARAAVLAEQAKHAKTRAGRLRAVVLALRTKTRAKELDR